MRFGSRNLQSDFVVTESDGGDAAEVRWAEDASVNDFFRSVVLEVLVEGELAQKLGRMFCDGAVEVVVDDCDTNRVGGHAAGSGRDSDVPASLHRVKRFGNVVTKRLLLLKREIVAKLMDFLR